MTLDDRLLKPAGWQYDDYKTAKQAILSDLLELIEDEAVRVPANDMAIAIIRNLLRQELREKVKEYCK